MNIRKLACLVGLLCVFKSAVAISYTGSFIQTITSTNDPTHFVGESWTGWIHYEAAQMDGTFYSPNPSINPPGSNNSLIGMVFFTGPTAFNGYTVGYNSPGSTTGWQNLVTVTDSYITITNGLVTDFAWSREPGQFFMRANETNFESYLVGGYVQETNSFVSFGTFGTMQFSAVRVPEAGSTLVFCFAGMVGVAALRLRKRGDPVYQ